jgi:hypothetical protein
VKVLLYPVLPDIRRSIAFLRFVSLVRLLFRSEQNVNEDEDGTLVELYWQGKIEVLGEKPVPLLRCSLKTLVH